MAKRRKSFKSLPKKAKKAAFAKMTSAGTLKAKSKSGRRTGAANGGSFAKKEKIGGYRISRDVYSGGRELIRVESPSGQISLQRGKGVSNNQALRNFKKAYK